MQNNDEKTTKSKEPSANLEERLAALEKQGAQAFPDVAELRLVELEEGELPANHARYIAVATLEKSAAESGRPALGCRIVEYFAGQGLMVEPAIYGHKEWKLLLSQAKSSDWTLFSGMGRASGLHPLYRDKERYPAPLRKHLLSSVRGLSSFVELLQREAPFPLHVQAALLRTVMREALQLLFATRERPFDQEPEVFTVFQREFVADGHFSKDHLTLYYQICGLARQARHAHDLDPKSSDDRFEWNQLTQRAKAFLGAFERYAEMRFSTAKERKRRRIVRVAVPAFVVVGLLALLGGLYISLKPIEPLKDKSVITQQGGIKATYFEGVFKKKVLERVDPRISLYTSQKPIPQLPADGFSVRWEGYLRFLKEDRHAICIESDDAARLWFNGKLLVDAWKPHSRVKKDCATVRVRNGWYPVTIEYRDIKGLAAMRLKVGLDEKRAKLVRNVDLCCRK